MDSNERAELTERLFAKIDELSDEYKKLVAKNKSKLDETVLNLLEEFKSWAAGETGGKKEFLTHLRDKTWDLSGTYETNQNALWVVGEIQDWVSDAE
jgi:hypothetical protein